MSDNPNNPAPGHLTTGSPNHAQADSHNAQTAPNQASHAQGNSTQTDREQSDNAQTGAQTGAQNPFEFFTQMNPFMTVMKSFTPNTSASNATADMYGQFMTNMTHLSQQIAQQSMRLQQQPQYTNTSIFMDLLEGWRKVGQMVTNHPGSLVDDQLDLMKKQAQLWHNMMGQYVGAVSEPVATPEKGDKRFSDDEWQNNPLFNFLKQNYLLTTQAMMEAIDNVEGIDDKTRQRLSFFTRQWINAIAPTNFLLTNPEVLRLTIESGGQNLLQGMKQLSDDMANSADTLNIRMTDHSAFRVGDNIATSKGKVVFENYLMQLIQYEPATEKVKKRPLLLVPPWINKFYIMDLREKNSFIRWAVNQGHTVFVLSWANPTPEYRHVGMDTYMKDGVLTAMDQIEAITGEHTINISGYCIGGMLTAVTLAYLAAKNQADRIASDTLWATIIDFSDPGDIGVFIDDKIVGAIDKQNEEKGVFDGRMMGVSFSLLRENSLYWNYYVQNYLKGERPVPFDLLYWNSDCTNVTAKLHHFLLREFYLDNKLQKDGAIEIDGLKINLGNIKTPVYMVATLQDHIAKWKSCYPGTQKFGGETVFVLGESGHIAGIMNPPGSKYGYYTNPNYTADADTWYKDATYVQDTWWHHWREWLQPHVVDEVPAREVGKNAQGQSIKTFGDAPGTYVTVKADEAMAGHNYAEAYRAQIPTK